PLRHVSVVRTTRLRRTLLAGRIVRAIGDTWTVAFARQNGAILPNLSIIYRPIHCMLKDKVESSSALTLITFVSNNTPNGPLPACCDLSRRGSALGAARDFRSAGAWLMP